jgi:hypothetical protein
MWVEEKIMALALALGEVEEAEQEALRLLCQAAESELQGQLREGISPEDCAPAFAVAAAWMALAGLYAGRSSGVSSFSAGDLTIHQEGGDSAALLEHARRVMAPYRTDVSFAFQGVKG